LWGIGWDSSPFVLNYETFQDKEKVKQFEEQSSNKGYHTVFNSSIPLFEKGPWQEYLVEMYFNSIGWGGILKIKIISYSNLSASFNISSFTKFTHWTF